MKRKRVRRAGRATLALGLALQIWGCAHLPPAAPRAEALDIQADLREIHDDPALLARLRATPHGYFRFVNQAFTREVCRRFERLESRQAAVTLHGDCHVEQYAVTDLGRGLTDFDDSAIGPAYIDIVRFGVSLELVARQRGWIADRGRVYAAFRSGYRRALVDPSLTAKEPKFVGRVKVNFDYDRARALARAEALMETLPEHTQEGDTARAELSQGMLAENAGLAEWFFRVKQVGRLRLGVGSALSAKYLARVEGPTQDDSDDIILEAKELIDREGVGCVQIETGPSRVFTADARIAYQPFRYPGVIHVDNKTLWVHAWPDNYVEVTIEALGSASDLAELAYDAGVQLGRGHPKTTNSEDIALGRAALMRSLPEAEMRGVIQAMTLETIAAWHRFRAATDPAPSR
jgi:hypothetical protein